MTSTDPYDALAYPGYPFPQSHPGRIAAQAMLRGLDAPQVERARVLELGCGDGGNLIPMAYGLRDATFLGVDLNVSALARARAHAEALGLTNIEFRAGDLERLTPDDVGASFDYVVAHGVYSWVSPPARDNLLALTQELLTGHGAAYISYNAKPGGYLRQIARELMQFATRGETDPQRIVERARGAIRVVQHAQQPDDVFASFLDEYLGKVLERSDAGVFHDDLEIHNDPVYLEELVDHAGRHGLIYLAEGDLHESGYGNHTPEINQALDSLEPGSEIEQEQALDFLRLRMYKQTLFCRQDAPRNDLPDRARIDSLHAYSPMKPVEPLEPDLADDSRVTFEGTHGNRLNTEHPSVKGSFAALGAVWPAGLPARDLIARSDDADAVRQALLGGHAAGLVQLTAHAPRIEPSPGDRPCVYPLARDQAAAGAAYVTNLKHERIPVADQDGRRLIALLDGTRDRDDLIATMRDETRLTVSLARLAALALLTTRPAGAGPRAASRAS